MSDDFDHLVGVVLNPPRVQDLAVLIGEPWGKVVQPDSFGRHFSGGDILITLFHWTSSDGNHWAEENEADLRGFLSLDPGRFIQIRLGEYLRVVYSFHDVTGFLEVLARDPKDLYCGKRVFVRESDSREFYLLRMAELASQGLISAEAVDLLVEMKTLPESIYEMIKAYGQVDKTSHRTRFTLPEVLEVFNILGDGWASSASLNVKNVQALFDMVYGYVARDSNPVRYGEFGFSGDSEIYVGSADTPFVFRGRPNGERMDLEIPKNRIGGYAPSFNVVLKAETRERFVDLCIEIARGHLGDERFCRLFKYLLDKNFIALAEYVRIKATLRLW